MFQILKADKMIDFMRWSKFAFALSLVMIAASIFTLSTKWLNWGLDFTGGTLIEVGFEQPANLEQIRSALEAKGFGDATVQNFGSARDVMVRLRPRDDMAGEALGNQILAAIKEGTGGNVEMRPVSNSLARTWVMSSLKRAAWRFWFLCCVSCFTCQYALNGVWLQVRCWHWRTTSSLP